MVRSPRGNKRNGASFGRGAFGVFEDVLALAGSLANTRRDYAAAKLETFAESVRACANPMSGAPSVKAYAGAAADSLDGLARYVVESDIHSMAKDASVFARRHPFATLATSIAAGVIATQMLQAHTAPEISIAKAATNGRRRTRARRSKA